jgi:hypothetical protein
VDAGSQTRSIGSISDVFDCCHWVPDFVLADNLSHFVTVPIASTGPGNFTCTLGTSALTGTIRN